jgi:peptidoglycan/xylan/chitin deacetylase (PgdA/CDA1 family)
MNRSVKRLLGRGLFAANLDALLLRKTAVVVAFHRVQEADPTDSLTVGAAAFERHCRFFKRHFNVVPLRDLVHRLATGLSVARRLAITFDDGYRDNFEVARPVLEKLSLPATFFIVSDWMGTDVVPQWDREHGVQHPWMTWDEVRSLHRSGFEIGAHTRNHVDLGKVSPDEARLEVVGARQEIERQVGARVDSFAYPYGGRKNVTEANRDVVRSAGFRCCCSGFGGTNAAGTDPFFLRRVPITPWHVSPQQFGFEVVLGRSALPA